MDEPRLAPMCTMLRNGGFHTESHRVFAFPSELVARLGMLAPELQVMIGSHLGVFHTEDELRRAIRAYYADPAGMECIHGPFHTWRYTGARRVFVDRIALRNAVRAYNDDTDFPIEFWDVSRITNMSYVFYGCAVMRPNLNHWDVSRVTCMISMFCDSEFNGDISRWDVSAVTNMKRMFYGSEFNDDISRWNVSAATDMSFMFVYSNFNSDISRWPVSPGTIVDSMLKGTTCTCDLALWVRRGADTSRVFG